MRSVQSRLRSRRLCRRSGVATRVSRSILNSSRAACGGCCVSRSARARLDQFRERCEHPPVPSLRSPMLRLRLDLPRAVDRATARDVETASPLRVRDCVVASSASRIGSASILRISLPMYCFCRYRPPCAVMRRASWTASRRFSGSGSASNSLCRQIDQRFTERLQVGALALAFALARTFVLYVVFVHSMLTDRSQTPGRRSVPVRIPTSCHKSRPRRAARSTPKQLSHTQADLEALVAMALDETQRLGASEAEVGISVDTGLSVTARLGEVETLEYQRDRGMGVTVYRGKRKGSASTADLSRAGDSRNRREGDQHRRLHCRR